MSELIPRYQTGTPQNLEERFAHRASGMLASEIRSLFAVASRPEIVSLAGGMPNLSALPMGMMASVVHDLIATNGAEALQYGSGQGHPKLREQICEVMALEGIRANADDVIVTTGSQQALDLISRIFIDPGDVILVEAPSYVGALGTFRQYEAQVVHISLDDQGLIPDALRAGIESVRASGRKIKFLYLIPNYQNPTGVLLSADRRTEILNICREEQIFVVEDNPYGLLGFERPSPNAMRAEDSENVIYLGSFSKTIASGLRVGWALVPPSLKEKLVIASESSILCPSNFTQMTISSYLADQPWRDQITSFCELYKVRRDAMLESLEEYFPASATWTKPSGGFYVWVNLPPEIDTKLMMPQAIVAKVAYVPGTAFYADGLGTWAMRLSYCHPTPERIREGVKALGGVVHQELARRKSGYELS
ncbi:MAG: aminotransferase class I/II-fold pyridoxal phosphate-dependent enzyme [Actinobacteria bacterium]|nr:aminotransferase class I/II-fold pyridoxal phosphate-dependent enzyme [Actinomycetota bacterium]MSX25401.1 aminotransferase class I/II-fold pyridoxal phosphate-dependent enzyme [Actinomycetota bacterium]MSY46481.1 aminotransferase class I/II-fold pyridoxal phosphate-dependent enzyme [Actinomycetota bacterium]MSY57824.1 aminotransferase class I/II-fold pyridoxal phosphate-dependent enzyme [Actinomycetota bacterium]MTB01049.1 aminotransferase class I/II-fold pyridoxal phosphate-dependent enzym